MKIGELAEKGKCTVETVRFYEKKGLLPEPERTAGNYRSYGGQHVERLRFIRNCRALDMSHDEIRALIQLSEEQSTCCREVNHLLEEHIGHVESRIAALQQLKQQLLELRRQCRQESAMTDCGILQSLISAETEPAPAAPRSHLG